jgi:hypothetical protein
MIALALVVTFTLAVVPPRTRQERVVPEFDLGALEERRVASCPPGWVCCSGSVRGRLDFDAEIRGSVDDIR